MHLRKNSLRTSSLVLWLLVCLYGTSAAVTGASLNVAVYRIVAYGNTLYMPAIGGAGVYLSRDNGESWQDYRHELPTDQIRSLEVRDGVLFAGTWGSGIYYRPSADESWFLSDSLDPGHNFVQHIALVPGSATLYAADSSGVFYRLPQGTLTDWERLPSELAGKRVLFIFCDQQDWLYAGLLEGGVYRAKPESAVAEERQWGLLHGLPADLAARAMDYGPDGDLWLATNQGIYTWNGVGWNGPLAGTVDKYVTALRRNPLVFNEVFIGTDNGQVWRYLNGKWTVVHFGIPERARVWDIGYGLGRRVIAATAQGPYWLDDVASVPLLPPFKRTWLPLILRSVAMPPAD